MAPIDSVASTYTGNVKVFLPSIKEDRMFFLCISNEGTMECCRNLYEGMCEENVFLCLFMIQEGYDRCSFNE